jgi:NLI interacting factor-like phosphatase
MHRMFLAVLASGCIAANHSAELTRYSLVCCVLRHFYPRCRCLLHSKFHCSEAAAKSYRQEEYRPETINSVDSFVLELPDGFVQCNKRPGLDAFLEALARMAKVVVFTAAMPDYAGPVLDVLDPTGKLFHRRLYRSSCRQVRGAFLKDLTVLGNGFEANPGRVILLDNNPCSFLCQPTNGKFLALITP